MHSLLHQFVGNLPQVVDLSHSHDGIAAQMRVDDNGLRVGVANDAQSLMPLELVQFILEAGAEIVAFQRVDRAMESAFLVESNQSGAFCT